MQARSRHRFLRFILSLSFILLFLSYHYVSILNFYQNIMCCKLYLAFATNLIFIDILPAICNILLHLSWISFKYMTHFHIFLYFYYISLDNIMMFFPLISKIYLIYCIHFSPPLFFSSSLSLFSNFFYLIMSLLSLSFYSFPLSFIPFILLILSVFYATFIFLSFLS